MPYDLTDPALTRVRARPTPDLWDPAEPLTLLEAAALMFPMGPVRLNTLRRARKQGLLATKLVCNRLYTRIEAVRAMTMPEIVPNPEPPAVPATVPTLPRSHPQTPEQDELLEILMRGKAPKARPKS